MTDPIFSSPGLVALLDTLVPPSADGRLPGAGQVGLADYLEERASDLAPLLTLGIAALDAQAEARDAPDFAGLAPVDRAEVLTAHAEGDPALVPALLFHALSGYYEQQAVVEALGLEHRPPFPEGYPLEATDPTLLDNVRQRPPAYRET